MTEQNQVIERIPVVYHSGYTIKLFGLEKLHPFDIEKYDKIYEDLRKEGFLSEEILHAPDQLIEKDLLLVHDQSYLKNLSDKQKVATYLEAPIIARIPAININRSVVEPFKLASGGTLKAARLALKQGAAINLGGGYHHAMPHKGEGFCLIADVPIAIRKLQKEGKIKNALIIDTDIHHGNGTVMCLRNDPSTFTFSMHEQNIYPWPKPKGDRDVTVPSGVTDDQYLETLKKELPRIFQQAKPDIVFHVAGCDALLGDPLANGKMTPAGIAQRDQMIFQFCKKNNVPYVMTLAGGYSTNAWKVQSESIKQLMKKGL